MLILITASHLSSDVGGFNFLRVLGCVSHCNRIAPGLIRLKDDGDGECNTSITRSHRSRAEMPSMRKPASKDMTSDSVELCGTAACFLHVQLVGTKVRLLKFLLMSTLSLEIIPICSVLQCFPHVNTT